MMNPPYTQGSKSNPSLYEINFTEHLLNSIVQDGKVVVIVPQSSMIGKSKEEKSIKANILKNHTLDGVITLNKNSFYGVGTNPCIAVFTAGVPHYKDKEVKFINFEKDGFKFKKHRGLVETIEAIDKKQHLLDVGLIELKQKQNFVYKTTIEQTMNGYIHSITSMMKYLKRKILKKTIADYLTFEFNMIMQDKDHLFKPE